MRPKPTFERDRKPKTEPALHEIIGAMIAMRTCWDDTKASAIGRAMSNVGVNMGALRAKPIAFFPPVFRVRSCLAWARNLKPSNATSTGLRRSKERVLNTRGSRPGSASRRTPWMPSGIASVRSGRAALVTWLPVPTREFFLPVVQETSRATGSRYGGATSTWGLGETILSAKSDAKVASIRFVANRLLFYTTVSRDIWQDSVSLEYWLNYVALAEFRFAIEWAIVNGTLGGPQGLITGASTVTVPKGATSSSSIASANIDAMWSALSAGSKLNSVWLANDDSIQKIDQLALSGQWPEIPYVPAGRYGNSYATIKGRPILPCEACPIIGALGT